MVFVPLSLSLFPRGGIPKSEIPLWIPHGETLWRIFLWGNPYVGTFCFSFPSGGCGGINLKVATTFVFSDFVGAQGREAPRRGMMVFNLTS